MSRAPSWYGCASGCPAQHRLRLWRNTGYGESSFPGANDCSQRHSRRRHPPLLSHILHCSHFLKIAALANDFGAINIGVQMVVGVEGEAVNLSNGCICCTIRGDLLKQTLKLRRREDPPEYIIVETSGVSDPIAVANTFLLPEIRPLVRPDSILGSVDADQILGLDRGNFGLALDQIAVADIVVLVKPTCSRRRSWI